VKVTDRVTTVTFQPDLRTNDQEEEDITMTSPIRSRPVRFRPDYQPFWDYSTPSIQASAIRLWTFAEECRHWRYHHNISVDLCRREACAIRDQMQAHFRWLMTEVFNLTIEISMELNQMTAALEAETGTAPDVLRELNHFREEFTSRMEEVKLLLTEIKGIVDYNKKYRS